ncbi:zinc ribbon domain-containing protein [Streptomyces kronopolitis]|uniref:Zinc ribbon domain-containing protein n=1 Tax=Streptomyces kronopolitis TaxID=1612435 RepID=A0ABQ2J0V2_9ACTN|nr:zinc ribbon domain-containing protein [Streptomyces kronopolitis]GGN36968.1 zinc ribbon domain-containing protein [Streptomyces kronopolitis]
MATDHPTCPDCGAPAPQTGQSFCDSCGAFLRWDRPTTPTPPTTSHPTPPAPAPPASPPDTARAHPATSGPDDGTGRPAAPYATPGRPAAPHAGARPAATDPRTGAPAPGGATPPSDPHRPGAEDPTTPLPATAAAPGEGPAHPSTPAARPAPPGERQVSETGIRALLVPVPDALPTAPPEAPGGVLPGRPEAARPRVRTPHAAPEPENALPCPTCAKPNAPARHFCHSCATPLTPSTRPEAEGPYAGERPRLHRDRTRWITRAVVAAALAAVVAGGIIGGPPAARAVQDHFADRVQVPAATWKASHSGPGHGAKLAFDTYSNTWWGTGYSGASDGQYLEAGFGQPTDLLNVVITPGASARTPQAADPARPHEFDVLVTDSAGQQHLSHYRLNDGGPQNIDVHVRAALTVRLILHSAYGTTDKKQVAIAELEFFGRSGG